MTKEDYRRLGEYIEPIDERNRDLSISLSQGINNNKYFQEPRQVAENSANDKIVRKGYFAYNRATTRNGEKISIAYREGPDCTVSSAYQVFRIINEEELNPHYLLLWFKRPRFDRYSRFKSHGSAHEFFEWDEMCDVMLPVPSIDEQRHIVEQYQSVERRIKNNERLIARLEDAAQAIYRHHFVDNIDPNNLPDGWKMGKLWDVINLQDNLRVPLSSSERDKLEKIYPYYGATCIMDYVDDYHYDGIYLLLGEDGSVIKENGTPYLQYVYGKFWVNNHAHVIQGKNGFSTELLYTILSTTTIREHVTGAVQAKLSQANLSKIPVIIPNQETLNNITFELDIIFHLLRVYEQEINLLQKVLQSLLYNLT